MIDSNIAHYGLRLYGISEELDEVVAGALTTTITIKSLKNTIEANILVEKFVRDITVMNSIRTSADPAVQEAYEQLLTVMALTNRAVPK